ncbi:DUF72 domain-containing protein [Pseudomonas edaphica]|uniref:DUF72 domain-containing protein n=1 Tax=Pseudomonas edaphica TaxID=2006980 RepID=A0A7Y7V9F4_9PSED|nr:DUF72 domain-containing protein [Pseudomonas edaphica]
MAPLFVRCAGWSLPRAHWPDFAGVRFSVKAPKGITHELRLQLCETVLDEFLEQCLHLGEKLGCLLIQSRRDRWLVATRPLPAALPSLVAHTPRHSAHATR